MLPASVTANVAASSSSRWRNRSAVDIVLPVVPAVKGDPSIPMWGDNPTIGLWSGSGVRNQGLLLLLLLLLKLLLLLL